MSSNGAPEELVALLRGLGWEPSGGEEVIGITLAVHTLTDAPDVLGCELLHFGSSDYEHSALHGLSELAERLLKQQHEDIASHN